MTKLADDEAIVARWTVDSIRLREFARRTRECFGDSPFSPTDLLKACDKHASVGLEVICRDDAVLVGTWSLSFLYNDVSPPRIQEAWLEFPIEGGLYFVPVPFPENRRAEVEGVVHYYRRRGEENRRQDIAERQAPTWSNRLLNIAEPHFVWVALAFFFIAIPVLVLIVTWLGGDSR